MEPTAATWITMILIVGFIWGGFALALGTAMRKESVKKDLPPPPAP